MRDFFFAVLALLGIALIAGGILLWISLRPLAEVFLGVGHVQHEWNQKLTLVVATPQGERTGSAVVHVAADFGDRLSGNEVAYGYRGEAVVVEVAAGRYLFALLGGTEERYACAAKKTLGWDRLKRGEWLAEVPRQAGKPPVPLGECLPLLVTFDDIADPKTVRQVDPTDLAASFGPGVALKAATLEVTEEPVTEGKVEGVISWINDLNKYRTDPNNPLTNNLPREIGYLRSN